MQWQVVFYTDEQGKEPVKDFILKQSNSARAEIIHVLELLYKFGLNLNNPFVAHVKGKLWELRIKHSTDYYRIFYFAFTGKQFVLLHAIKKKQRKLRKRDIELAEYRMNKHIASS